MKLSIEKYYAVKYKGANHPVRGGLHDRRKDAVELYLTIPEGFRDEYEVVRVKIEQVGKCRINS